jgi:hypothetical protein
MVNWFGCLAKMNGRTKEVSIVNSGRLARDKKIKCIFIGTYKTEIKKNKVCFFIITIVTNIHTVYNQSAAALNATDMQPERH